jgi:hypothetical protein
MERSSNNLMLVSKLDLRIRGNGSVERRFYLFGLVPLWWYKVAQGASGDAPSGVVAAVEYAATQTGVPAALIAQRLAPDTLSLNPSDDYSNG